MSDHCFTLELMMLCLAADSECFNVQLEDVTSVVWLVVVCGI